MPILRRRDAHHSSGEPKSEKQVAVPQDSQQDVPRKPRNQYRGEAERVETSGTGLSETLQQSSWTPVAHLPTVSVAATEFDTSAQTSPPKKSSSILKGRSLASHFVKRPSDNPRHSGETFAAVSLPLTSPPQQSPLASLATVCSSSVSSTQQQTAPSRSGVAAPAYTTAQHPAPITTTYIQRPPHQLTTGTTTASWVTSSGAATQTVARQLDGGWDPVIATSRIGTSTKPAEGTLVHSTSTSTAAPVFRRQEQQPKPNQGLVTAGQILAGGTRPSASVSVPQPPEAQQQLVESAGPTASVGRRRDIVSHLNPLVRSVSSKPRKSSTREDRHSAAGAAGKSSTREDRHSAAGAAGKSSTREDHHSAAGAAGKSSTREDHHSAAGAAGKSSTREDHHSAAGAAATPASSASNHVSVVEPSHHRPSSAGASTTAVASKSERNNSENHSANSSRNQRSGAVVEETRQVSGGQLRQAQPQQARPPRSGTAEIGSRPVDLVDTAMGCKGSKRGVVAENRRANPAGGTCTATSPPSRPGTGARSSAASAARQLASSVDAKGTMSFRISLEGCGETKSYCQTHSGAKGKSHLTNVVVASPSLWFCLAAMAGHRTFRNGITIIDSRRRSHWKSEHVFKAVCPWPPNASSSDPNRLTEEEKSRLAPWLKSLCHLRTVLLYGSSRSSTSSEQRVATVLQFIGEASAQPKEVLILDGGIAKFLQSSGFSASVSRGSPSLIAFYQSLITTRPSGESVNDSEKDQELCVTEVFAPSHHQLPPSSSDKRRQRQNDASVVTSSIAQSVSSVSNASLTPPSSELTSPFGLYFSGEAAILTLRQGNTAAPSTAADSFLSHAEIRTVVNLTHTKCPLDAKRFRILQPFVHHQQKQRQEANATSHAHQAAQPSGISLETALRDVFPPLIDTLADEASAHRSTLIYDASGDSYSPLVTSWFLIEAGNPYGRVLQYLQRRRPTICFDSFVTTFLASLSDNLYRHSGGEDATKSKSLRAAAARQHALAKLPSQSLAGQQSMGQGLNSGLPSTQYDRWMSLAAAAPLESLTDSTDYYKDIDAVIADFSSSVSEREFYEAMSTLSKIFNNVLLNPNEPKYRTVKLSNPKFLSAVGRHPQALRLLSMSGWVVEEASGTVELPGTLLVQKMRDVQSRFPKCDPNCKPVT